MLVEPVNLDRNCPSCNKLLTYKSKVRFNEAIKFNKLCQKCMLIDRNKNRLYNTKSSNSQWKGYEDIPFSWFSKYFLRRKSKNKRSGSITIKDIYDLWILQDKKCALSGIPIGFYDDGKNHTCSIDRIDSLKEYELNNIQLVHKDINIMKNKFNNAYFINICKLISNNN